MRALGRIVKVSCSSHCVAAGVRNRSLSFGLCVVLLHRVDIVNGKRKSLFHQGRLVTKLGRLPGTAEQLHPELIE
jgi:hypothetical protein